MRWFWSAITAIGLCACNRQHRDEITWSGRVADIVYQNCTPCHRPGEAGGFNLTSYEDAAKRARLIRFVTQSRYMPPWPADPAYSHFAGERWLTKEQIDDISEWAVNGAPRGDSLNEPRPPFAYTGSFFRKPDMVLTAVDPVYIKGNGTDVFLIQKFPYHLPADTLLDFVEFVPGLRRLVHHVNGHLVNYDPERQFNYESGLSVVGDQREGIMKIYADMHIPYTDGKQPLYPTLTPNVVYYLPGYEPPSYANGIGGYRIRKDGLFLLNNVHYGPSRVDTIDISHINLFFRKEKINRPVQEMQLGTFGASPVEPELAIPANEKKTFRTRYNVPFDMSIVSVNPHMHLIGTSFKAFAVPPSGDTIPIISIPHWDFRWQYYYQLKRPLKIPAGSQLEAIGEFDNTASNPNNPSHPPKVVTSGNGIESMKTSEEMFQFIFSYMKYLPNDEKMELQKTNH